MAKRETTLTISAKTGEALVRMSTERGMSTSDLVTELVREELERALLVSMAQGFAEMSKDSSAWEAYRAEQRIWDSTIGDGL